MRAIGVGDWRHILITLRKSEERGQADHGWLKSYHTFSFASYYDPAHVQFRDLRVINEDWIEASSGFPTHPHNDMEIVTYIVEGELEHKDSMGNGSIIRSGEIQRMSAGTGIAHSEFNHSDQAPVHLLQIWIHTEKQGIEPDYEQKNYTGFLRKNELTLIASRGGRGNSIHINQDVNIHTCSLERDASLEYQPDTGRFTWVQVIDGEMQMNDNRLSTGDGAAISDVKKIIVEAEYDCRFLLFDLK
jgi:redox-sensitive bicupin YhaK (pirin superfamily)